MTELELVRILEALSQTTRLRTVELLGRNSPEGRTPAKLAEQLALAQSTMSFHLKALQRSGLLTVRRQGKNLYYSLCRERVAGVGAYLSRIGQ